MATFSSSSGGDIKQQLLLQKEDETKYIHSQWNQKAPDHALLYVGAGDDMGFPFQRLNVLIDSMPRYPFCYYGKSSLLDVIHAQLSVQLGDDIAFEHKPAVNRWMWYSKQKNVRVVYYHSLFF